tara:strand:- start:12179 stop:12403 length:225 start_codon:yes stop_codon:yes gene_type:complete
MSESDFSLPPVRSYGKRELYNLLKERNLVIWNYDTFMKWVYDDPLSAQLTKSPAIKKRKVLLAKEVKILLQSIL